MTLARCTPVIAVVMLAGMCVAASADSTSDAAVDPVQVFNKVCYTQVPSVEAIRKMAGELAWQPLEAEDLEAFSPDPEPELLDGWDIQVGKRFYRLGLARTGLSDAFRKTFPAFADGKATSCTLVLDGNNDADKVAEGIQKLAGKEPVSRDVAEGVFKTTTWSGGNDEFKVFLVSKAGAAGETGLLNVTILQK